LAHYPLSLAGWHSGHPVAADDEHTPDRSGRRVGLALAAEELALLLVVAWQPTWRNFGMLRFLRVAGTVFLADDTLPDRARRAAAPYWRWLGVAAAAVGYALTAYGEIRQLHQSANVVVYITCIAAAIAHANVVMLCSLRPSQMMWLRWLTIAAGVATTAFVSLVTYLGTEPTGDDLMSRAVPPPAESSPDAAHWQSSSWRG